MNDHPECDRLPSWLRTICRGESGLTRAEENAYRATEIFGNLLPLSADGKTLLPVGGVDGVLWLVYEECKKYAVVKDGSKDPGRDYGLCVGRRYGGREDTIEDSIEWRRQHKLTPLPDELVGNVPQISAARSTQPTQVVSDGSQVGTEFEKIVKFLKIEPKEGDCSSCTLLKNKLNVVGISGCNAYFDQFVTELRLRTAEYSLKEKLTAANQAIRTGLVLEGWISPIDPMPGLLRIAINREVARLAADSEKRVADA